MALKIEDCTQLYNVIMQSTSEWSSNEERINSFVIKIIVLYVVESFN